MRRDTGNMSRVILSVLLGVLGLLMAACGSSLTGPEPPEVFRINNATAPQAAAGATIEVTGEGFLWVPGHVEFRQGSNLAYIVPDPSGWSDTSVLVTVPDTGDEGPFEIPGVVQVRVSTPGGASREIPLSIQDVPSFRVTELKWSATHALPEPVRGHTAVAVPGLEEDGFILVAGGNDGTDNLDRVWVGTVGENGLLHDDWKKTAPLPEPRAYHGMEIAHQGNSPVSEGEAYVYVLGGQPDATASPGGSVTTWVGKLSLADGSVSEWSVGPDLPVALLGMATLLDNGYLYVLGGLQRNSDASDAVYVSRIAEDGSLDDWTEAGPLPTARHSSKAFAYGGSVYLVAGDGGSRSDPSDQTEYGASDMYRAVVRGGQMQGWEETSGLVTRRSKHALWASFGQVLVAGGVHPGSVDTLELEHTRITDEGPDVWDQITDPEVQIGAHVFNGASVVSPVRPPEQAPRLLLLGGQKLGVEDTLTDEVFVTQQP